jgi:predicted transcriptional regulator
MIKSTARLLGISLEQAGSMLVAYHWDAQALIDAFMEDAAAVASRCGVSLSDAGAISLQRYAQGLDRSSQAAVRSSVQRFIHRMAVQAGLRACEPTSADDESEMCPACLDDVPRWKLVNLGCGHDMCESCWRKHLTTSLAEFQEKAHVRVGG